MPQVLTPVIDPAILQQAEAVLWASGSQYRAGSPLNSAATRAALGVSQAKATFAAVATTSGTSIDFTGIPAGVTRITLGLAGVSTNGTSPLVARIGDSGGIETAGYSGGLAAINGVTTSSSNQTTGFFASSTAVAADTYSGALTLVLMNAASNLWSCTGSTVSVPGAIAVITAASKALSATLDRVSLTTAGGVNTFDSGSMNISWEF